MGPGWDSLHRWYVGDRRTSHVRLIFGYYRLRFSQ